MKQIFKRIFGSQVAKPPMEVEKIEVQEDNVTLDARLDKIALGSITTVKEKEDLPSPGVPGAYYGVTVDKTNQNLSTLYIYSDGYRRIVGSNVS